ncbi:hypothetical protein, partial [Eggerthella sp. 1_3_56FAA]|uniref:hypothetical protein n=1 Tax=Eggerthella sp. 1_3_56FAA TaxID=665943 RepID=UPI001E400656
MRDVVEVALLGGVPQVARVDVEARVVAAQVGVEPRVGAGPPPSTVWRTCTRARSLATMPVSSSATHPSSSVCVTATSTRASA